MWPVVWALGAGCPWPCQHPVCLGARRPCGSEPRDLGLLKGPPGTHWVLWGSVALLAGRRGNRSSPGSRVWTPGLSLGLVSGGAVWLTRAPWVPANITAPRWPALGPRESSPTGRHGTWREEPCCCLDRFPLQGSEAALLGLGWGGWDTGSSVCLGWLGGSSLPSLKPGEGVGLWCCQALRGAQSIEASRRSHPHRGSAGAARNLANTKTSLELIQQVQPPRGPPTCDLLSRAAADWAASRAFGGASTAGPGNRWQPWGSLLCHLGASHPGACVGALSP